MKNEENTSSEHAKKMSNSSKRESLIKTNKLTCENNTSIDKTLLSKEKLDNGSLGKTILNAQNQLDLQNLQEKTIDVDCNVIQNIIEDVGKKKNIETFKRKKYKEIEIFEEKKNKNSNASENEKNTHLFSRLGRSTSGKQITIENLAALPNEERYHTKKMIGKGGMGVVMLVDDNVLQREVAMKLIKNEKKQTSSHRRFIQEAQITGSLEHNNIITIYDLSSLDDLYFTMRLVKGITFLELIQKLKKKDKSFKEYTLMKRLRLFQSVCNALEYAHSKNIIHRDLKPENIMVGNFGEVFVLDWGLAKKIDSKDEKIDMETDNDSIDQTRRGSLIGTPRYMSPEQAKGRTHKIDKVTDVYALGTILYEIISLESVFQAKDLISLIDMIVHAPIKQRRWNKNNEFIPRELMAIATKALSKKKEDRYQDVKSMHKDIELYMEGRSVSAFSDSFLGKFEKFITRNATIVFAMVLFCFFSAFTYHFSYLYIKDTEAEKKMRKRQRDYSLDEMLKELESTTNTYKELMVKRKKLIITLRKDMENSIKYQIEFTKITTQIEGREAKIELLGEHILRDQDNEYATIVLTNYYKKSIKRLLQNQNIESFQKIQDKINIAIKLIPSFADYAKSLEKEISIYGKIKIKNKFNIPVTIKKIIAENEVFTTKIVEQLTGSKNLTLRIGSYVAQTKKINFPFVIKSNIEQELKIFETRNEPINMIFVPESSFYVGTKLFADDYQNSVNVKAFYIDETEVMFSEYLKFYQAVGQQEDIPKISFSGSFENLWNENMKLQFGLTLNSPVFGVTLDSAKKFCKWKSEITGLSFHLPKVKEWEKAARGVDGRIFPWGNIELRSLANISDGCTFGKIMPVKSFLNDKSIYGVFDMSGNVAEWTSTKSNNNNFFVKGSNINGTINDARTYTSNILPPKHIGFVGFRCVCRSLRIKNK